MCFWLWIVFSSLASTYRQFNTHLCIGEAQAAGNFIAIRWRKIFLVQEALLQLEDLLVGECGAGLAFLLWIGSRGKYVQRGGICKTTRSTLKSMSAMESIQRGVRWYRKLFSDQSTFYTLHTDDRKTEKFMGLSVLCSRVRVPGSDLSPEIIVRML